MGDAEFTAEEFSKLVFKNGFDKDFLKQWVNDNCIAKEMCTCRLCAHSPLQWAADAGYLDVVKYLVENGADITSEDNYAFRWAATQGRLDVVKYLLNTFIYSEKVIHDYAAKEQLISSAVKDLMVNYKQFSNTKACRH